MCKVSRRNRSRLSFELLEAREVPATFAVTTAADVVDPNDHKLSLREAISRANANPDADTITLPAGNFRITLGEVGDPNGNGGGDFDISSPLTIKGVSASKTAVDGGGTVRVFDIIGQIPVTFANMTIRNGGGFSNGAGIQSLSADIALINSLVTGNRSLKGGGINNDNGSVTLFQTNVRGNVSTSTGGGINMGTGKLTLTRSKIADNIAKEAGGGVNSGGEVSLNQSVVSNNTSNTGNGGGIRADTVSLTASSVLSNQSGFNGGGVSAQTKIVASKSVVSNNRAALKGGGLESGAGTVEVSDSTVSFNSANTFGGGVDAVTVNVARSKLNGNSARNTGGGIQGGAVTVVSSTISSNSADSFDPSIVCDGGGIHAKDAVFVTSTISGNFARDAGGGIFASNSADMVGCTINGNSTSIDDSAPKFGGGLSARFANLNNTTVSGNTSLFGGGVSMDGGSLSNVTITRNTAFLAAGLLSHSSFVGAPLQIAIRNSIIAQDSLLPGGSAPEAVGQFLSLGHNLIGDATGSVNFTAVGDQAGTAANPINARLGELANNGGPTLTHALLAGSPAIDHGDNGSPLTVDQRGTSRIKDGNRDGVKTIDIGAFER